MAALKSKVAIDGKREEVADRVASFPARLGSREPENYPARASPMRYEYDRSVFAWPHCSLSFFLSFFLPLHLPPLSFPVIVDSHPPHSSKA